MALAASNNNGNKLITFQMELSSNFSSEKKIEN